MRAARSSGSPSRRLAILALFAGVGSTLTVAVNASSTSPGFIAAFAVMGFVASVLLVQVLRLVSQHDKLLAKSSVMQRAMHEDVQTRLGNHRQLVRDAGKAQARHRRWKEPRGLAFIGLDIVSDAPQSQDHLMFAHVVRALSEIPRGEDAVYHLGEREFAVLLTACSLEGAGAFHDRLRDRMAGILLPSSLGPGLVHTTVGIAASGPGPWALDSLMDTARSDLSSIRDDAAASSESPRRARPWAS